MQLFGEAPFDDYRNLPIWILTMLGKTHPGWIAKFKFFDVVDPNYIWVDFTDGMQLLCRRSEERNNYGSHYTWMSVYYRAS